MQSKLFIFLFMTMMSCIQNDNTSFQAERVQRTATIVVNAPVEKSFPLFGPIREKEWAAGWEPSILLSKDLLIEEHMIFQTKGNEGEGKYTWAVTTYRPEIYLIEYTVFTSERIWFIKVKCDPDGEKTKVTVTYEFTGLTIEGNRKNKFAIEKMFSHNLRDWEGEINQYFEKEASSVDH